MTYPESIDNLKESIERAFPNTEWEFDSESTMWIEKTNYFSRYVKRITKYTSYSPTPFLRELVRNELDNENVIVLTDYFNDWFGVTLD